MQQQKAEDQPKQQQHGSSPPRQQRTEWRAKWQLERVASVNGVVRVMQQLGLQFTPAQWVRAFVQVSG